MAFNPFAASAAVSLALALGLAARLYSQHQGFQRVVRESLATSEGYDQQFINLVNHLEDVLTTRASFPYPGVKDPMTGRRREMAAAALVAETAEPEPPAGKVLARAGAKAAGKASARPAPAVAAAPAEAAPAGDRVRLTAIIADDYGQHTAIVMDGERSMSVDIGDLVGERRVVRITGKELTMEDDATVFTYGLNGSRLQQRK